MTELDHPKFGDVWEWDAEEKYLYICPTGDAKYADFMPLVGPDVLRLRLEDNWTGGIDARWSLASKGEVV